MKQGFFITFEGGEGAGKSTHITRLAESLRARGHEVVTTREPGGTPLGEQLRALVLAAPMSMVAEALLYAAARAELMHQVILPALERRAVVLCDRFVDSSLAYQGHAGGLGEQAVRAINQPGLQGRWPDLTLYLRLSPEQAIARRNKRLAEGETADRIESREDDFHRAVRQAFETLSQAEPHRIIPIDASPPKDIVQAQIAAIVQEKMQLK